MCTCLNIYKSCRNSWKTVFDVLYTRVENSRFSPLHQTKKWPHTWDMQTAFSKTFICMQFSLLSVRAASYVPMLAGCTFVQASTDTLLVLLLWPLSLSQQLCLCVECPCAVDVQEKYHVPCLFASRDQRLSPALICCTSNLHSEMFVVYHCHRYLHAMREHEGMCVHFCQG